MTIIDKCRWNSCSSIWFFYTTPDGKTCIFSREQVDRTRYGLFYILEYTIITTLTIYVDKENGD